MSHWYTETFADLLADIERGLHAHIARQPQRSALLWEMITFHFGWHSAGLPDRPNGKRVRPLMTLLVARALTGDHLQALPAALAVELVHNFTLIHDDVMDKSLERRHRPTLWAEWGASQAINAGDGLFSLGMSALLISSVQPQRTLHAMQLLLDACVGTVEGQMLDIRFETQTSVTPDEYLHMITLKSAVLIACAARMGAVMTTDDTEVIDAYGDFAHNLGIAFQIWDDYLGIWGDAAVTGKSTSSDIANRKKSYPVLAGFHSADETVRAALAAAYSQDTLSPDDVQRVVGILDTCGAADETRRLIDTYYSRALAALDAINIHNRDQQHLRELANFLIERAY